MLANEIFVPWNDSDHGRLVPPCAPRRFISTLRAAGGSSARLLGLGGTSLRAFALFAQFAFGLKPVVHVLAIRAAVPFINLIGTLRDFVAAESELFLAGGAI